MSNQEEIRYMTEDELLHLLTASQMVGDTLLERIITDELNRRNKIA